MFNFPRTRRLLMITESRRRLSWGLVVVCLSLAGGCLSNKPGSASMASTVIDNATMPEIRDATALVFERDFYHIIEDEPDRMVFEREGTQTERVLYAGYGEALTMRVVVQFESYREDSFLLRADAYTMRGEFGQPEKLLRMASGSYQALLDRVRVSLIKSSDSKP